MTNIITTELIENIIKLANNNDRKFIQFFIDNKLIGFPLNRLDEIKGDYNFYIDAINEHVKSSKQYDANGNIIWRQYVYKDNGFMFWKTCKRIRKYTYDEFNRISSKTTNECTTKYEYDSDNNIICTQYNDTIIEWKYVNGNLTWQSINGNISEFEYDENGNILRRIEKGIVVSERKYDTNNNLIWKIYNGIITEFEYDDHNNLVSIIRNNEKTTYKVEYWPDGQLKQYRDMHIPHFEKS